MDHAAFTLQSHHTCLSPRKHSPYGGTMASGSNHLIAAYYSFIDPERMKGWVDLVSWPTADGLPILMVTHQLQARERPPVKDRRSSTELPPTNQVCDTTTKINFRKTLTIPNWHWFSHLLRHSGQEAYEVYSYKKHGFRSSRRHLRKHPLLVPLLVV